VREVNPVPEEGILEPKEGNAGADVVVGAVADVPNESDGVELGVAKPPLNNPLGAVEDVGIAEEVVVVVAPNDTPPVPMEKGAEVVVTVVVVGAVAVVPNENPDRGAAEVVGEVPKLKAGAAVDAGVELVGKEKDNPVEDVVGADVDGTLKLNPNAGVDDVTAAVD